MSTRVVVVDDHERFRLIVRGMLEAAGMPVAGETGTGLEGVRPHLVLLDLHLPDVDEFAGACTAWGSRWCRARCETTRRSSRAVARGDSFRRSAYPPRS
jgi:CheY-like chemotaxis protein